MTARIYTPFTYLIGWKDLNLWYYGVRFARNCHPDDLWTTYFTSSKTVKQIREEYGDPDVVEIRQTFNDSLQARLWEETVLRRIKAVRDRRWLNKSNCGKEFCNEQCSKEHRRKISISLKGSSFSEDHRKNLSEAMRGRVAPNKGVPHSEETKSKISKSLTGVPRSEESRRKQAETRTGKTYPKLNGMALTGT